MNFRFDFEKSLQAAGCLLELHGDRMEYVRLLKLLYIADREMMAEAGAPITGDRAVAMDHGPVLAMSTTWSRGRRPGPASGRTRSGRSTIGSHCNSQPAEAS